MTLRTLLTPEAQDLYDHVSTKYPAYEDPFFMRRGSTKDAAFRNLLEAVTNDTAEPQKWKILPPKNADVAHSATDPETLRRAWAQLDDENPEGWKTRWVKSQRDHRRDAHMFWAAGIVVFAIICIVGYVSL